MIQDPSKATGDEVNPLNPFAEPHKVEKIPEEKKKIMAKRNDLMRILLEKEHEEIRKAKERARIKLITIQRLNSKPKTEDQKAKEKKEAHKKKNKEMKEEMKRKIA